MSGNQESVTDYVVAVDGIHMPERDARFSEAVESWIVVGDDDNGSSAMGCIGEVCDFAEAYRRDLLAEGSIDPFCDPARYGVTDVN